MFIFNFYKNDRFRVFSNLRSFKIISAHTGYPVELFILRHFVAATLIQTYSVRSIHKQSALKALMNICNFDNCILNWIPDLQHNRVLV